MARHDPAIPEDAAGTVDVVTKVRREEALLKAGALQNAIFNSENFSSIATDAKGVIQIFNVGAERMLGYTAIEVVDKITPADISDPQEVIARAKALSIERARFCRRIRSPQASRRPANRLRPVMGAVAPLRLPAQTELPSRPRTAQVDELAQAHLYRRTAARDGVADIQSERIADAGSAIRSGHVRQPHPSFAWTIHGTIIGAPTAFGTAPLVVVNVVMPQPEYGPLYW